VWIWGAEVRIQFGTQSYRSDTLPISAQRCVNMYAEMQPRGAKTDIAVFGCPGIADFTTCGAGPIRWMHQMGDYVYVVSGAYLYRFDENALATQLGGQISGTGVVTMDDNGLEVVTVNGVNGYIYDETSGFRLITDTDFHAANTVSTIDSMFLFDEAGTNRFFRSEIDDGTDYSSLAFGSADTQSDNVLAVLNKGGILHVFGQKSLEFHGNTGAANFPFQRIPNSTRRRGIISPHAKTIEDDAVHFLADDRIAYRLNSTEPKRISTHAIEKNWERHSTLSDASAFAYTFGGHKFINFNLPTANESISWDISTGLWHERVSHDRNGINLGRWRANCTVSAFGKTFVGDAFSGKIGYMSDRVFTEFGNTMHAEVVSPPIHGDGKMVSMPAFELEIETGVGLTGGQGSKPRIMLDVTDDGGHSFEQPEAWASMGEKGQYGRPYCIWDRLGSFYQRSLRVRITDPVRRTIIAARCPGLTIG
jgi:hypothetical protein